jgi:phosphatidylinositol alpha-1,6-mannosyltransferase
MSKGYEYKGVDQVIRALPWLAERVPGVRYVILGGGDALPDLARLAAEVGVADRVEFQGVRSDEELWEAMEGARVFALLSRMDNTGPSLTGEGFGIVYGEAAAFGRPVVGSTMGGASEAVVSGTTGLTVDPTNPEAVALALLTYLEDPERADREGAAGRGRVLELLTPERFATNLLAHLRAAGFLSRASGDRGTKRR